MSIGNSTRAAVTTAALVVSVLLGANALFLSLMCGRLARGRLSLQIVGVSFGVAAISLLVNGALVLLSCRTGPMPMAFSKDRPLVWVAFAAAAIAVFTGFVMIPK